MKEKLSKLFLSYSDSLTFLERIISCYSVDVDVQRRGFSFLNDNILFIPPLLFPGIFSQLKPANYLSSVPSTPYPYLVIIAQAGNAALGLFEDGEPVEHRAISRYMVRKKQGKAQINYLQHKGKSRYGSRLRLQEGVLFFEDINRVLQKWSPMLGAQSTLFYSFPDRFWEYLFAASPSFPFERNDTRLVRVPIDLHKPNFKELCRVNYFLSTGQLVGESEQLSEVQERIEW